MGYSLNGNLPDSANTSNRLRKKPVFLSWQVRTQRMSISRLSHEILTLLRRSAIITATITHTSSPTLPDKLIKLKGEKLAVALPHPNMSPDYRVMESLRYLSYVIQECPHVNLGASTRMPRISANKPLYYQDIGCNVTCTIPTRVPNSMSSYLIQSNLIMYLLLVYKPMAVVASCTKG